MYTNEDKTADEDEALDKRSQTKFYWTKSTEHIYHPTIRPLSRREADI